MIKTEVLLSAATWIVTAKALGALALVAALLFALGEWVKTWKVDGH